MRIILHEIKKLWNIKILAIIIVFNALYYVGSSVHSFMVSTEETASHILHQEFASRFKDGFTDEEFDAFITELGLIWDETGLPWENHGVLYSDYDGILHNLERAMSRELWEWKRQQYLDAMSKSSIDEIIAMIEERKIPLIEEANMFIGVHPVFADFDIYDYDDYGELPYPAFSEFEGVREVYNMRITLFNARSNFVEEKLSHLNFIMFITEYYGDEIFSLLPGYFSEIDTEEISDRQRQRMIPLRCFVYSCS